MASSVVQAKTNQNSAAPLHRPLHRVRPKAIPRPVTTDDRTVTLSNIETPLVPMRKTQGDREFGGNGPDITCRTDLRISADRRSIEAVIYFKARETKSDWSTTEETFVRTVYRAPSGKTIDRILDGTRSQVNFRSRKAGFQILGPGEDFQAFIRTLKDIVNQVLDAERTLADRDSDTDEVRRAREVLSRIESVTSGLQFQGNHVHVQHPSSGPVAVYAIVGDTGGDDISKDRNPKDDTRIQAVEFKPLRVRLR